jgi:hypothetical protein
MVVVGKEETKPRISCPRGSWRWKVCGLANFNNVIALTKILETSQIRIDLFM